MCQQPEREIVWTRISHKKYGTDHAPCRARASNVGEDFKGFWRSFWNSLIIRLHGKGFTFLISSSAYSLFYQQWYNRKTFWIHFNWKIIHQAVFTGKCLFMSTKRFAIFSISCLPTDSLKALKAFNSCDETIKAALIVVLMERKSSLFYISLTILSMGLFFKINWTNWTNQGKKSLGYLQERINKNLY